MFRIKSADHPLGLGAFRSGKYKFILNEFCSGWYTFDRDILAEDPLTDDTTVCNGHPCSTCGGGDCGEYFDYLFDLEADPREEHNLIEAYPEVGATYVCDSSRLSHHMLSVLLCMQRSWAKPAVTPV